MVYFADVTLLKVLVDDLAVNLFLIFEFFIKRFSMFRNHLGAIF